MNRMFIVSAIIVAAVWPVYPQADELVGFDTLKWGSPISSIQGESRTLMGGNIQAVRQPLSGVETDLEVYMAYKIFYFCGDAGLCGGKLFLAHDKKLPHIDSTIGRVKSILGSKYGHIGQPGRTSDSSWSLEAGTITVSSGVDGGYPVVEVLYRTPNYNAAVAQYESSFVESWKGKIDAWSFRF